MPRDGGAVGYGQCWEDADVLLAGLDVQPGDTCLSIASGGDNTLALLARAPSRVVAVDGNPAQIACLELRVAAYRQLRHAELLELIGSRPSDRRPALYCRCRDLLSPRARAFWDGHIASVAAGLGSTGRFECYLSLFRQWLLPLAHGQADVAQLLAGGPPERRERFYEQRWDTPRWRLLFHLFFSRLVLGRFGRGVEKFRYVRGSVARRLLNRTRAGLTTLDPAENPYLQWILLGRHAGALPFALRPENFESIRARLDRLEWHAESIEQYLARDGTLAFDRCNLSDIFEYVPVEHYHATLASLVGHARPGARLAYWNLLVPRHRPPAMAHALRPLDGLADALHRRDKAFFYDAFVLEEVAA